VGSPPEPIEPARLSSLTRPGQDNMAPLRGWGPRSLRLRAKVPARTLEDMTFLAGAASRSHRCPMATRRVPINGEKFRLYVERVLVQLGARRHRVWTISAATRGGPSPRDTASGAKLSSCRNTRPTSNPIGRSSPAQAPVRKAAARSFDTVTTRHRTAARQLHATGMRQLLRELRLSTGLKTSPL